MCRRICVLVLILFASMQAFAEEWFSGTLYLRNDIVLRGTISVKPEYDIVLFKIGEGEETILYPAHKIEFLEINDPIEKATRRFASLHIGVGPKSFYQFYEVIVDGPVSVFRRQHTMWYSIHLDTVDYDYFILFEDQLYGYNRFKKKIYPHLNAQVSSVGKFVKDNRLNLSRLNDITQIVQHYNLEFESSVPVASNQER
jgi:hypothetical protein